MRYRCAIRYPDGSAALVLSRSGHTFHAGRGAALRELEAIGRRSRVNLRGYLWAIRAAPAWSSGDIAYGLPLPGSVETVQL